MQMTTFRPQREPTVAAAIREPQTVGRTGVQRGEKSTAEDSRQGTRASNKGPAHPRVKQPLSKIGDGIAALARVLIGPPMSERDRFRRAVVDTRLQMYKGLTAGWLQDPTRRAP